MPIKKRKRKVEDFIRKSSSISYPDVELEEKKREGR
jgi:hypothetical protein